MCDKIFSGNEIYYMNLSRTWNGCIKSDNDHTTRHNLKNDATKYKLYPTGNADITN